MYSPKRQFRLFRSPAFAGGSPPPPAGSSADILSFSRTLATTFATYDVVPTDGGALTINSQPMGNYEVTARKSNTTISSFTASDWFTNTKDTTSSWIIVNGNLTINAGQTLIPPVRKLFTVVYVTGNLVCNGGISMTARGANHSGTGDSGGATTAAAIRIGTGTFSGVANPQIPAAGGAGATGTTATNQVVNGSPGSNGGTGGGGAGGKGSGVGRSGNGAAGTCFSGGSGGGASPGNLNGENATANGGKGGDSVLQPGAGGTGNPGGTGSGGASGPNGNSGTGGVLFVIVAGTISGSGTLSAAGVNGVRGSGAVGGGASGGGSITLLCGTDSSSLTTNVAGGTGDFTGSGGAGTYRNLAIGAN